MKSTLYKKSKNGKLQIWQIETEDDKFRTTEGYLDGKQTPTEWTSCQGKRIGSTNETSPQEQSIKEAEARVRKQLDKGWTEDINSVDEAAMKISPMLAHKYLENEEYALSQYVAVQPKLDGIRLVATRNGLFSRTGKPINSVPHIWEEVKSVFDLRPETEFSFDGELYNCDLYDDFNAISSIVRKQKPTPEELQRSKELIQYHVYDLDLAGATFNERDQVLRNLFENNAFSYVKRVATIPIQTPTLKETLYKHLENFFSQGYEGMMIRSMNSLYQNCRSKDLLKWKEFQDEEFEVTDIVEGRGNRAGIAASVYCKDKKGEEFSAGLKGTVDFCRELLKNKDQYIGKMCTVKFQNLTPDRQVPRFGKVIDFNRID